jgi:hypothetical protein
MNVQQFDAHASFARYLTFQPFSLEIFPCDMWQPFFSPGYPFHQSWHDAVKLTLMNTTSTAA